MHNGEAKIIDEVKEYLQTKKKTKIKEKWQEEIVKMKITRPI